MVCGLHLDVDDFVLILEIYIHDDALGVGVNLDGVVAGEKVNLPDFHLENHLQQGATKPLVPHDSGEDEVVGDVQVLPAFESWCFTQMKASIKISFTTIIV